MGDEQQPADEPVADASTEDSSDSSDTSTGDSFMDTYGDPRLTTTERREDQSPREHKVIPPGRTRRG